MKTCCRCGTEKAESEFYADSRKTGRLQSRCKECQKELSKSWWRRNGKKSYLDHKAQQLEWRKNNPEKYAARQRRYHLKKKYDMTEADFQALVVAQGGKCACCGDVAELVIDHDHAKGDVRELLCQPCNKGLGCFMDKPERLAAGIRYLEKHKDA